MTASVVLTIKSEKSVAELQKRLQLSATKDQEGAKAVEQLIKDLRTSIQRGAISVQTGSGAPVAAASTWTLATVIDTDACSCAGTTLTFTTTPTTEAHVDVNLGSALAFASSTDLDLDTGTISESTHGYLTGDVVRLTTSSALPAGLALATDYYVIKVDADTYRLASSLANAIAGHQLFPTTKGTGNQTVTPQANKTMAARLATAVNAHSSLSLLVSASVAGAIVTVTCLTPGIIGNHIAFASAAAPITASGSGFLAAGTGGAKDAGITYSLGL